MSSKEKLVSLLRHSRPFRSACLGRMRLTLKPAKLQQLKPFQLCKDVAHGTLERLSIEQPPRPPEIQSLLEANEFTVERQPV